ncbi:MAG: PP2C family protein-serine/threonine phosphatase [Opitutales bacterium]
MIERAPETQELEPLRGIRWWGTTDTGKFRKHNEDAFLALTLDAREVRRLGKYGEATLAEGDFVFAVSDGMGGAKAGEFASRIAVDKITQWLPKSFGLAAAGLHRGQLDYLTEVVENIHKEMTSMSFFYEECRGMGATLSMLWFGPKRVHFAHVGDSRIYYVAAGQKAPRQLTEDHTFVGQLVRTGRISPTQAKVHPQRNVLQQALGGQATRIEPQLGTVYLSPGDRLILVSDGVSGVIGDPSLAALAAAPNALRKEESPAERLVHEAIANHSRDNATAIVVEVF